ncbi:aminopeptidase N [Dermacoccus sp. PE3]|uniref:aminopeptidase N n=1 Tax=Dermacoccus sp. PE3 TaxID=1641401 RepID=UPI0006426DC5|nr:aminopeptidase N [Dermacoccus sp. PE3]KLO62948.1 aminopeptidase N [Dermacoccus sp. PE3]
MTGSNLTREEALERSANIAVDSYDITLDLTTGAETFTTSSTVRFSATPGSETWLDFLGESVDRVVVGGEDIAVEWDGARVRVPNLAAENEVRVDAVGRYMNTGEGLHRFVDPADNEVYLYSQFEVPDARRMYPVFEQPDLKASFTFTVTAPARWQVLSNEPTPEPQPAETTYTGPNGETEPAATWRFGATPRISCYITALVAGPYEKYTDEVTSRAGTVPLGVYCRKSLAPHMDADEIFDITKRGFAFFENEFDQPYPFTKYDQIFTPEYNMGAMENAGCVTFTEMYVFRAKVSEAIIERRALTVLHELAHMWFGNLVTMKWWNDLWLNESFAEWASTTAQAEATRWESAWTTFGTSEKAWAYRQDQLSSTHPIVAPIRDLADVEVNFDGITYAKGASVLKQLVAYVGRESFTAGLRAYFAKYAWQNTTLPQLLGELESTSGRDLSSWSKQWLETAGVNTLRPVVEVDGSGVMTRVLIQQSATNELPTLRPHRLAVGCYRLEGDTLVRTQRVELDVTGESTEVTELVGVEQPDLLLVNDDDLAYAKIRLDERSLATAIAHPRAFTSSLPRALVLGAAWDMTRDAQMPAGDFVRMALATLPGEDDSTLLRTLLGQMSTAALTYSAPAKREKLVADATGGLRSLAEEAEAGSDAQLQLVQTFASFAQSEEDVAFVRALLSGERTLDGLTVDTEMRWTLLTSLAAAGAADAAEIDAELARDNTATGAERAARARASLPTSEAKAAAWSSVVDSDELANQTIAETAAGFGHVHDVSLLEPYVEKYFAMAEDYWAGRTHHIAELGISSLFPMALAGPQLLDAAQQWLSSHSDSPAGLVRTVAENRDAVARAVTAQEFDARA